MRSWRATYGPPVYGHRSDDLSQTARDDRRPRPLRGLLLVILLGLGTHASKQSLGPLEPTLHAAGMGPLGFGALTVVPGIASIVLPTVWGAAWAKRAPFVLVLSPLAQLVAQVAPRRAWHQPEPGGIDPRRKPSPIPRAKQAPPGPRPRPNPTLPGASPRFRPRPNLTPNPNPNQTLLVTGLSPMADGWLSASALTLGLLLFSLGRYATVHAWLGLESGLG